jgi:two-component system response regulator PilR (NtrC family)
MSESRALIVDDEPDIRALLEITLGRMGILTESVADVTQAKTLLEAVHFDLCLTDMHLPDGSGIDLVRYIQSHCADLPVAVITAYGSMDTAINALKAGAFDYVTKPVNLGQLRELVSNALQLQQTPNNQNDPEEQLSDLIGNSAPMLALAKNIRKLARSQAPIYISGESGSGKERVAKLIHKLGPRASENFVPVNCGAIPAELMESEFFGHKKGSFTGAHEDKLGLFQSANGGTLFLDEVADLPLSMQVKLLRCLQEKKVRPIGAAKEVDVNVRVLCATHKDLLKEVEQDQFRQDLYYRLNVIQVAVPPLRHRKEDLPSLCGHFIARIAKAWSLNTVTLSDEAKQALQDYDFPGNVRELENILERAITLCDDQIIERQHLQLRQDATIVAQPNPTPRPSSTTHLQPNDSSAAQEDWTAPSDATTTTTTATTTGHPEQAAMPLASLPEGATLEDHLLEIERQIILNALEETRWNRTAAAKKLGLSFRSLRYRLKKLGLDDDTEQSNSG